MAPTQNFTNSSLIDMKILTNNYTIRTGNIEQIMIHTMAGNCWVDSCGYMFQDPNAGASSNYGIGSDGRIGLYVEEKYRAWTSGGVDSKGQPIRVNGISGADMDHRGVTIEVASLTQSEPFKCSDAAWESLVKLCADICKRNNIKELKWRADMNLAGKVEQQNIGVHRWFAYKSCPGDFLYQNLGRIADEVNGLLGLKTNYAQYDKGPQKVNKGPVTVVGSVSNKTEGSTGPAATPSTPTTSFKMGDIITFLGGNIYASATAPTAANNINKTSECKITNTVSFAAPHPYHVVSQDGKGVYGWVDSNAITAKTASEPAAPKFESYTVRINTTINIRKGPGTTYGINGTVSNGVYTIVEEAKGVGANLWGKLKSGAGWIALDWTTKVK